MSLREREGNQIHLRSASEVVLLIGAVLLIAALGYTVHSILSPFVLAGAVIFLLYPLRAQPMPRRMMWLSILLLAIWFFYSILALLAPFIVAFLIAYILNPLILSLERRNVPRWVSSLTLVVLLVAIVFSILLFVMPLAFQQFEGIISAVSKIVNDLAEQLQSGAIFESLARYGIPVDKARQALNEQIIPRLENLLTRLFEGIFGVVTGISSLVVHIINAIIIPFLLFYLLRDFPSIANRFYQLAPASRRQRMVEITEKVDALMGRYFRGAVTVAIIQGTIAGFALWVFGVHYSLVLGIMTGVLNFIPYIGLLTSLIVSSIVAMFSGDPVGPKVVAVVVLYLSQKLLEATVLGPKIIGSQVGLHPLLLILCLLVFGYFLGFVGLLIAVPATALILAAFNEWQSSSARNAGFAPQRVG